jgi:predicted RecB family nuclease
VQALYIMYTGYEKRVINDLIGLYPDLEQPLRAITDRLYDLHPVTKNNYCHPDMHGSWSIKKVLPTVAPDLSYDDLDIVNNGAMAEPVFLESINESTPAQRSVELREALLSYCKLDTEAMVRLAHYLEGRSN